MLLIESIENTSKMTYLHYWYDDYESSPWKEMDFNAKKKQIVTEQLARFSEIKKKSFSSKDISKEDYEKTLEIFLGKNTQQERKQIFEGRLGMSAKDFLIDVKNSGFNVRTGSYQAFNNALKAGEVDLSSIAETTQTYINKLNENLDTTFNKLFTGNTWKKYKEDVISSYLKSKGEETPTSETGLELLEEFKSEAGRRQFIKLSDTLLTDKNGNAYDSVIQGSLKQLAGIAAGLELAGGSAAYTGDSSYFKEMARIVPGLMTNVAGSGLEVVVADAEENICDGVITSQLEKLGFKVQSIGNGVITCGTSVIQDPAITQDSKGKDKSLHRSTADVRVSYEVSNGQGKMTIDYGINVKNYQTIRTNADGIKYVDLKIKDGISFMDALQYGELGFRGSGFYTYLYNLAGGHPETRKNKNGTTGPELTQRWKELVELATLNGLLAGLVGSGTDYDRNLILMINGTPYTMDEVLNKVLNDKDETNAHFVGKARYRGPLMDLNYWRSDTTGNDGKGSKGRQTHNTKKYDTAVAKHRSQQAIQDIHRSLEETKLKIYLKFFLS